jgi:hypothetical protein
MLNGCTLMFQVRLAEHVITQHRVAVKILDLPDLRRRDLESKGKHARECIVETVCFTLIQDVMT